MSNGTPDPIGGHEPPELEVLLTNNSVSVCQVTGIPVLQSTEVVAVRSDLLAIDFSVLEQSCTAPKAQKKFLEEA
jgi:hypothetical protein